jgi:hypothetical protein
MTRDRTALAEALREGPAVPLGRRTVLRLDRAQWKLAKDLEATSDSPRGVAGGRITSCGSKTPAAPFLEELKDFLTDVS